jgi:hypothetical protein
MSNTTLQFNRWNRKNQTIYFVGKGKAVAVHDMEAYMGSRIIAPLVLNLASRWRSVVNFISRPVYHLERTPVPTEEKVGWLRGSVRTFWRRDKFLAHIGFRTPDIRAPSLIAIPDLNLFSWHNHFITHLYKLTREAETCRLKQVQNFCNKETKY